MACLPNALIFGRAEAEIAALSGQSKIVSVENDHTVLDRFWVLNSVILARAAEAIALRSGLFSKPRLELAHDKFVMF